MLAEYDVVVTSLDSDRDDTDICKDGAVQEDNIRWGKGFCVQQIYISVQSEEYSANTLSGLKPSLEDQYLYVTALQLMFNTYLQ